MIIRTGHLLKERAKGIRLYNERNNTPFATHTDILEYGLTLWYVYGQFLCV